MSDMLRILTFKFHIEHQEVTESFSHFSGENKAYGYKVEVPVVPTGLAISCTDHYSRPIFDIGITRKNLNFHEAELKKPINEKKIIDLEMLIDK